MYTEFPCLQIFPLHNFQKKDCLCILAHTFGIGLLLLIGEPPLVSLLLWSRGGLVIDHDGKTNKKDLTNGSQLVQLVQEELRVLQEDLVYLQENHVF